MATAHPRREAASPAVAPNHASNGNGRDSNQLKLIPESKDVREQIRARAAKLVTDLDRSRPLARHAMEAHSREVLADSELPETYLGWTMVTLASVFWEQQVTCIPHDRRLLLLPRCLRNEKSCPAEYNELGLLCQDCGACSLTDLRSEAHRKGYKVMIAEGSPAVMQIILGGHADALLGVACLDVLERTLDKILLAGIPCMAVPLLTCGCSSTSADADWIRRMVDTPHRPTALQTHSYLHLMRCAARMFEPEQLERLIPRSRGGPSLAQSNSQGIEGIEPIAGTEVIAYDFLAAGGKHSRPFITLAVYDALAETDCTGPDGASRVAQLPDAVKCMALAIETFHKASLVHDDIEDGDACRYGQPTLHQKYGMATAINIGDYLIGLGYRLVAGQRENLPPEMVADVLAQFATAHTKLCEGQGAELLWRDARNKRIKPLDALKLYALKTAPAFEAAIMAGIRLAGPVDPYREAAARFARHLGVAYQILNDLDDWEEFQPNKGSSGGDVLGGRPTVLWALALEALDETARCELESLLKEPANEQDVLRRATELYERAGVFEKATALISKHHQRARAAANEMQKEPLRHLLNFLADAILDRRSLTVSEK